MSLPCRTILPKSPRAGVAFPRTGVSTALALAVLGCMSSTPFLRAQAASTQTSSQAPTDTPGKTAPGALQANTGAVVLTGLIADPDDAEIPGATLTLTATGGKAYTIQSEADGSYTFRGVPPGTYSLTVTMPGFASFVRQAIKIGPASQTINAKLAIQDQQTVVNVTANQNTVSVDQDQNASSTVLKGKDLDALSDDPDELSSELTALAGPSAGPNGGQIYIDGFTGGQLPPKSSIREIRINQNPFSAQYDKAGFGRVEIFTKPGTDKFHLFAQINGNEKDFNTGSPFTNNADQPGYHTIFSFGQFSGPLSKTASFTVGSSIRQIQSDSIVNPPAIFAISQTSGVACLPGQTGCSVFTTQGGNGYSFSQFVPQLRFDVNPRVDLALSEKNTMTIRFQYEHNNLKNQGIGGVDLQSAGEDSTSAETTLQVSDSQIVSDKIINETRFEYQRPTSTSTPFSTAAQLNVQGAFVANSGGGGSTDTQNHIEVQNYTSVALTKHLMHFGGRLRFTSDSNTSTAGNTGTFSYSSICDYAGPAGCTTGTTSAAGNLSDFDITQIIHPTVSTKTVDLGLYAEDDWKIRPNWTLSYGLRYETQNYIHDQADFAPRLSTAYGLGKKTVLRAGAGYFYDRFQLGSQLTAERNNGLNENQFTLSSTNATTSSIQACSPNNPMGAFTGAGSTPYGCDLSASRLTINSISSNFRAPYTIQENVGIDQQLFTNATASVNYQHIHGAHQFNSDVPNYATASTSEPLQYQYQSEGDFNQNQLIVNINVRGFHNSSIGGFYALNFADSDTGGINSFATIPNHLKEDYGRATFDTRNRLFLYGSFTLPHLISISPLMIVNSGSPYNITSGLDEFGDNQFNSRAVFAAGATTPVTNGYIKSIAGCGNFATPGTPGSGAIVPINYCTGPATATFNLRATKTFGFGPSTRPVAGPDGQGGRGGPGGGRGGPGGGGRGPGFGGPGGASSGKKYNLALGFQAQNLFNEADLATPVGTLSSPSFGHSTSLDAGPFTSSSAIRRISFQASFNF